MAEVEITEEKISFFQAQLEAMKSLRKAFELDEARVKQLGVPGSEDPFPSKFKIAWLKLNWMNVIIWVVAAGIMFQALKPKKDKRRSHHGINKYGQPY